MPIYGVVGGPSTRWAPRTRTSSTGGRAVRPGLVVPGEAHLVVPAPRTLDGHVELVADALVLLLEQHLHGDQNTQDFNTIIDIHIDSV